MEIIVMSDAHGLFNRIKTVVDRHQTADYLLYAGDTLIDLKDSGVADQIKIVAVRGNTDISNDWPALQSINLAGQEILLTHGDRYNIKWGLDKLYYQALELEADIVIFGHTHQRYKAYQDGILFFNPGSISRPRDQFPAGYGLITIESGEVKSEHFNF